VVERTCYVPPRQIKILGDESESVNRLKTALLDGSFLLDLDERSMEGVLRAGLDFIVARELLDAAQRQEIEAQLLERERTSPTVIGDSVAIPHTYSESFHEQAIVFIRLKRPINLNAPDGIPTRFFFLLLGPPGAAEQHLDALAGIARLMSDDEFRYESSVASTQLDLVQALDRFVERNATGKPPKPKTSDLEYSGRFMGGLMNDIQRRWALYASDFTDGFNSKALAAVLFLFFACLAPAVTFGGIMAELTNGQIGVVEMLVATAVCGVIYSLFAGQPLILLGGTGPLLVFTWVLYELCVDMQLGDVFLETYAWIGIWTAVILILMSVTEASCLMRYVTRFTDETFGGLMSIIFIYTAIKALTGIVSDVYSEPGTSHDEALVPLLLTGGTFYIAMSLSRFRKSRYLLGTMRTFLADFGPAIAMALMTALSIVWFSDVETSSLSIRGSLSPSIDRSWFVNPFDAPRWIWFASIGPAILVAILIYIVHNVTARLINSPDNKLQKGAAYHLDLLVIGVLVAICSFFGLPWFVAATVRSLNQLKALSDTTDYVARDGSTKEKIAHVCETRVTALVIHLLIAVSLSVLFLLKVIPMAVLYGLFLYMGVVSLTGNQLFERISLLVTDPSLYPSTHYIRRVPTATLHAFTLIQFTCLVLLTIVSFTSVAIFLPLLLVLLVPLRMLMGRIFNEEHLLALDAEENPEAEEQHWF